MEFDLKERTIILTVAGSRAYGLHTDTSDVDMKGVCIPTAPYFHGFMRMFEQADKSSHMDPFIPDLTDEEKEAVAATKIEGSVYDIRKFCLLASQANPNILDVLFCRDEEVRICTALGERLRDARDLFVSAKAMHTFSGYANQQLKRIRTHRRWLMSPPAGKPTRGDHDLPEETLIPKDQLGAAEAAIRKQMDAWAIDYGNIEDAEIIHIQMQLASRMAQIELALGIDPETGEFDDTKWLAAARYIGLDENFVDLMHREKRYKAALTEWQQYQHWVKTRNPERAALEKKHGFDCYTDDTEFLTDSGWKGYDDVTDEDLLATVYVGPPATHRKWGVIEYQKPTERFDGTFTGNLHRFFGHHTEMTVTPNHRMLCRHVEINNDVTHEWELKEAAHLGNSFDFLRTVTPRTKRYTNGDRFEGIPIPDRAYMTLMGWVLSDGTFGFEGDRLKDARVTQKKGGKLSWKMARFQADHGDGAQSSLYEYERKPHSWRPYTITERVLCIRHRVLRERLLEDCGHKDAKRIPRWVFELSRRLMERLFDGLVGGDGTERDTNLKSLIYYTSLKGLADDVQELALHCGWETALWGPYRDEERDCTMWQVHVNKNTEQYRRLKRSKNLERVAVRDQRIVCFTVPNGTLITRKNGKIGIHGNSKHGAHLVRLLRMGSEILTTGKVHVWRGGPDGPNDREELLAIRNGAWSYEKLIEWSENLDAEMRRIFSNREYTIPKSPKTKQIDALCQELVEEALKKDTIRQSYEGESTIPFEEALNRHDIEYPWPIQHAPMKRGFLVRDSGRRMCGPKDHVYIQDGKVYVFISGSLIGTVTPIEEDK